MPIVFGAGGVVVEKVVEKFVEVIRAISLSPTVSIEAIFAFVEHPILPNNIYSLDVSAKLFITSTFFRLSPLVYSFSFTSLPLVNYLYYFSTLCRGENVMGNEGCVADEVVSEPSKPTVSYCIEVSPSVGVRKSP
ncbi:MAG: hypothetical protein QXS21_05910 [Thermoproteota archaeon]